MRIYVFLIINLIIFCPSLVCSSELEINGTNNSNTTFTSPSKISTADWSNPTEMERSWKSAIVRIPDGSGKSKLSTVDKMEKELLEEIKKFQGKDFTGTICQHPFLDLGYDYEIPMLEARFVTTEQGTGIVHCAPSHGPDDFNLCLKYGIKAIETVDGDGKYTKNLPLFEGTHIFKANPIIIEKLKEQKKLLSNGELIHSYPHSWRSKAPLVHRATPQWFISMESHGLRKKALKALDETKFYPDKGRERIKAMIQTRPDWCVSRQRVWGVPLPIFVHKTTKKILADDEVNENIASIYEKEGSDCWFSDDPQRFLGDKYKAEDYDKISDIVEVWFDSGCTHAFVLEKRDDLQWPASMYLEGSDQHRGWFHSSLLESCGTRGRAPYESILSHGFVVDGKGLKMSKSVGNVIAPEDILKKYGADILRIWVASSNYAEDLRIDYSILEQHADSYRKIRNTFRYLLGNINDDFKKIDVEKLDLNQLPELEQYMLHRVHNLNENYQNYFKSYDFHNLYKELLNFCTVDLSAFYFDIRKDALYCDLKDSEKRKSSIIVLNIILESLIKWFAPILSFTTEEIFILIKQDKTSIHLEKFKKFPKFFKNDKLNNKWEELKKIRQVCLDQNLDYHLDGARLFNALVAKNETPKQYGELFDTISICLSKGLGAPVGSILLGSKTHIAKALRIRKLFGGGMRQAGYLAAAGTYALKNNIERLKEDHKRAKYLGAALNGLSYVKTVLPVITNIVIFEVVQNIDFNVLIQKLAEQNIKVVPFGPQQIRLVTHLNFTDEMLEETIKSLKSLS